jgi:SAM-dependent methyltransferase
VVIPQSGQYATDVNLRARQRLWEFLEPPFDLFRWVLDLTQAEAGSHVLDVGCGNGAYLARLQARGAIATGCDLSLGMLEASAGAQLVNADAQHLPFRQETFDVVLGAHMLYHVPDQRRAVAEMRRVLAPGGTCVVVTNGAAHIASLRQLVESVVQPKNPDWRMFDWATRAFSLDDGEDTLRSAFETVELVRPPVTSTVIITDADVVADYVASVADAYQDQLTDDWTSVVKSTRLAAQAEIDGHGRITTKGDTGAFVCR